jgi:hypothetical protein
MAPSTTIPPGGPARPLIPHTFAQAVGELRSVQPRKEIVLTELPAPQRLAPFAYALGATIRSPKAGVVEEVADGRLILLYDPAGQEGWQGPLRLVSYVTAELEPDLATDPLLPEVAWSWLTDALAAHAPGYTALAGTVTQTTSTRFGDLAGSPSMADVEIRASWTPDDARLAGHLSAWCEVLASTAGLPPPGVSALPGR